MKSIGNSKFVFVKSSSGLSNHISQTHLCHLYTCVVTLSEPVEPAETLHCETIQSETNNLDSSSPTEYVNNG